MKDFCNNNLVMQSILDSAPLGLIVIDPHGEIMICNDAAAIILGTPAKTLLNRGWGELFLEDVRNAEFNQVIFDVIMKEAINHHRKTTYFQPGGELRHLSLTSSFLHEEGQMIGIVVILDDITELAHSQEREKELMLENSRIQQEKIDSLQTLALAVAHQIRNPSMIIGGITRRLLKTPDLQSGAAAYLEKIVSGVRRLEGLVSSVMEYVALSSPVVQETSLSLLMTRARDRLDQRAREKSMKVICRFSEGRDVSLRLDPEMILKALDELMLNSLEFHKGETVEMELGFSVDDLGASLTVKDQGTGISEKNLPYVFDLFFSTKVDGIGMGLPKVRRIVDEHQGRVEVTSRPGQGTEVTVFIPFVK